MNLRERAIDYLSLKCGQNEFWAWSPDAKSVVWADGSVVASREELVAVLRHLQASGLPPFGAIVHLLAGCRGKQITITWFEASEDEQRGNRIPCAMESGDKQVRQCQRVRLFGSAKSISSAAACLTRLPAELEGLLDDPRTLLELADLAFNELENPEVSEGLVTLLAESRLSGEELNHPPWHAKYPTVLSDLALLAKAFDKWPPKKLRSHLAAALAIQRPTRESSPWGFILHPTSSGGVIRVIRQFKLPLQRKWQEATACHGGFCAASVAPTESDSRLAVIRSTWEGTAQIARWHSAHPQMRVLLVPLGEERILAHQAGCPMLPDQFLPPLEGVFAKRLVVGCAGWLPPGTIRLACDNGLVWVLAHEAAQTLTHWRYAGEPGFFNADSHPPRPDSPGEARGPFVGGSKEVVYETKIQPEHIRLTGHSADGQFCQGYYGPAIQPFLEHRRELVPMVGMHSGVALGVGSDLVVFRSLDVAATYHFDRPIRDLFIGNSRRKTGIVIGFGRGVKLHWHGSDEVLSVDEAIVNPVAAFSTDGKLVVAGDECGRVYDLDRYGVGTSRHFRWAGPAPISIMATASPAEFATLSQEGLVKVWKIL
jgi:hypothetical protein